MLKLTLKVLALLGTVAVALSPASSSAQALVKVDGSSTVYPVTEAVAEEFQDARRGAVRVTVGISGTGGGFKKFCRGETDVQDASRPILAAEVDACKQNGVEFIELPVAFDALTVIVNPKNTWARALTVAELKRIWEPTAQGKILRWNQVRAEFPDAPLKLYGAGADSGTFDYFTEAINGKSKSSRGDFTASEDDNVLVQGVATDQNALGYFGFAYYVENQTRLAAVAIDGGRGPVLPSEKAVLDGTYSPLSRPLFIYISKKSLSRPEVKDFVTFYLQQGATLAQEVKYVPLPPRAYAIGLERVEKGKVGTAFGGKEALGSKIDEILSREPRP